MKAIPILLCLSLGFATAAEPRPGLRPIPNREINYPGFLKLTTDLEPEREKNRITEEEFIQMAKEPGTVVLDARSKDRYESLHIKGAIHLAFTDFTQDALRKLIPDTNTRILIYCNNNFQEEPVNFAAKSAVVALNIQTYINLRAYGYTNVKELGPLLKMSKTRIEFERTNPTPESLRPSR